MCRMLEMCEILLFYGLEYIMYSSCLYMPCLSILCGCITNSCAIVYAEWFDHIINHISRLMSVWKFLIDHINYIIHNTYVFGGSGMYFVLALHSYWEHDLWNNFEHVMFVVHCLCTVVWFQFLLTGFENEIYPQMS